MSRNALIEGAILSYPHLFKMWAGKDGDGDAKYSCKLILPKDFNWDPLMAAVTQAATDKFGATVDMSTLQMPWERGPGVANPVKDGPYAGYHQIGASAYEDNPPRVIDQALQPVIKPELVFAGCEVDAYVYASGYDTKGNKGVRLSLDVVRVVRNDESVTRLDSRKDVTEIFKPVAGAPAMTAPAVGGAPPATQAPTAPGAPQTPAEKHYEMTPKAAGATYESFIDGGWTDAQMIEQGYMVEVVATSGSSVPPGAPANPYR